MEKIDFRKIENYDTETTKVIPFSRSGMTFNGMDISFGNMNPKYPVKFFGYTYPCPEYIYITGFYGKNTSECIEIQKKILSHKGGAKTLKTIYRKNPEYTKYARSDFDSDEWKFHLMLYAVWLKCLQNDNFSKMLTEIPDDYIIVENQNGFHGWSIADWGCKNKLAFQKYKKEKEKIKFSGATKGITRLMDNAKLETGQIGVWVGMNHQGKILMACRKALIKGNEPPIDYCVLNNAEIYLFGKRLIFLKD